MNSKPRISYTRPERRLKTAWDRVLNDPSATPGQLALAARGLERLAAKAARRAKNRPPAPDPVEALVRQYEAEKAPLQNQQHTDTANALNAAVGPPIAAKALEVTQTPETPQIDSQQVSAVQKCWNCDQPGQPTWDSRFLCPTHFAEAAAQQARPRRVRQQSWLYEKGEDENTFDLSAVHGEPSSDYQKSVEIWRQQAVEESDRQERDRQERTRAEAAYHRSRADWIANGGRL